MWLSSLSALVAAILASGTWGATTGCGTYSESQRSARASGAAECSPFLALSAIIVTRGTGELPGRSIAFNSMISTVTNAIPGGEVYSTDYVSRSLTNTKVSRSPHLTCAQPASASQDSSSGTEHVS